MRKKQIMRWRNKAKRKSLIDRYLIPGKIITIFDTETTGLKDDSKIIQFSAIKYLISEDYTLIFNNTSLDVADSYRFAKSIINCEIMNPEEGFYPWVKRTKMYPTRFSRACCSIFKTGVMVKNLDKNKPYLMFMGLRNEESSKRADYKDEWKNIEWGKTSWQGILPIRTWTELEVWLYIMLRDLPINEKYKKGYQRVGCGIACPFYTKTTWVLDDYWYPYSIYQRWRIICTLRRRYFGG